MSITALRTTCKKCVFATYEGKTQTGCQLGLIEKFRENGKEVVEAYDEEREFFVINNTFCPYQRNETWKNKKGDDLIGAVRDEVRLRATWFIYVDNQTIEDIVTTLRHGVLSQTYRPELIVIVLNSPIRPSEIRDRLGRDFIYEGIPYRVTQIADRSVTQGISLDIAVQSVPESWLIFTNAGGNLPSNFLESLDKAINREMRGVVMVRPNFGFHGLALTKSTYRYFNGNEPAMTDGGSVSSIVQKLDYVATQEGFTKLIIGIDSLCSP